MNNTDTFITLEAWISDQGDGSSCIRWFMPNCGPNEDSEDFDFEKWAVNEGSGQSVEVRRGSKQHQEAWLAFHNRKTFVLASDKNTVEFFTQRNWIPQPYKEYIQFNPPVDWDKE